jgi:cysteine desulfurase / selenocysteine lyase
MNIDALRAAFPIFNQTVHGNPLVYLDSAATAQKPEVVIAAMSDFYRTYYGTVHRALYPFAERATVAYEAARGNIQQFINAAHPDEIIFTRGTTESINFVANTWALNQLKTGDEILLTQAEHHANLLPWQRIARATGAILRFIPIDPTTFMLQNPSTYIQPGKTKLIAVSQLSNVLGPIWQPGEFEAFVVAGKKAGACILIDAAQSITHQTIDVQALNIDFLAFSGHKLMGPTGVGVLYINRAIQPKVEPYHVGGSMVYSATFSEAQWAAAPQKFEAGTPAIAEVIGLGTAVKFIQEHINMNQLRAHHAQLCSMIIAGLNNIPEVRIVGNQTALAADGHVVSFAVTGLHAHDVASQLGLEGIAVRAGHHCAQPLVTALKYDSLVRVSLGCYNTAQDIEIFLQALTATINLFKKLLR